MPEQINVENQQGSNQEIINQNFPKEPVPKKTSNDVEIEKLNEMLLKNILKQGPIQKSDFPVVSTKDIPTSGRFPLYFPGRDNEEMYAQGQSVAEKARNGVIQMAGIAGTTFINGTVGLVNGVTEIFKQKGKLSAFYDNDMTRSFDEFNNSWNDKYALYKTERERSGSWWEPENLFTANFLFDNIVKNMGFMAGAAASGFTFGAAFKAMGLTAKLMSAGTKMAAAADATIAAEVASPNIAKLSSVTSKLENLWNGAKQQVGKGLMKADQGIVAFLGTTGEAGMEALGNSQEFRKNMIDEFVKTHGYSPTENDLKEINKSAESVGNWSLGLNVALLTATNYIQFPKMLGSSYKAEKGIINELGNKLFADMRFDKTLGKYVSNLPEKGFGKLLYKTGKIGSLFFNRAEAFEEGAQFAIQTGTQNYFDKKYRDHEASFLDDGLLAGAKEALTTDEGLLNIFTGGFSGALSSSGAIGLKKDEQGRLKPSLFGTGKIGERGFTGYGGEEGKLREEKIAALNKSLLKDNLTKAYSSVKAAEIIQKQREEAIRRGDILESKDLEFDYAHTFIEPRLKYGASGTIFSEIKELKQQAQEDFAALKEKGTAAETDTQESFIARLDNLKAHAEHAIKVYDSVNLKYKGLVDKDGKRVYSDEVLEKLVYAGSKIFDYNRRVPQLAGKLLSKGITTAQASLDEYVKDNPSTEAVEKTLAEIEDAKNEKNLTEDDKKDLRRDFQDLQELSLRRKQFLNEYKDIVEAPKKYEVEKKKKEETIVDDAGNTVPKPIPTIKVKTKKGERDIEIGTEYMLGKRIFKSSFGESEVFKYTTYPTLTVIKENADGTIKIKDANGQERDVDKDVLLNYNLAKVSTVESNIKAKFYKDRINKIYKYYGKKKTITDNNGNKLQVPVEGMLGWSDKTRTLLFTYMDGAGKIKTIEVDGKDFVASEGFAQAKMVEIGEVKPGEEYKFNTPEEKQITPTQTEEEKKQLAEVIAEESRESLLEKKVNNRITIIEKLITDAKSALKEANNKIEANKKKLEKLREQLEKDEQRFEELSNAKKPTKEARLELQRTLDAIKLASEQIPFVEKMIANLTEEEEEFDRQIEYLTSMLENVKEMPTDVKDVIQEFEDNIKDLNETRETIQQSIKTGNDILSSLKDLLTTSLKKLSDFVSKLKSENKIPVVIDEYLENLEKFYGEEGAKQFIAEKLGYTEAVLALQNQITLLEDELKIPSSKSRSENIQKNLKELEESYKKLSSEQRVKESFLMAFKNVIKEAEKRKQEEEVFKDENVIKGITDTADVSILNKTVDVENGEQDTFEPGNRKEDLQVVSSTTPTLTDLPHHKRANLFGVRFPKLKNKANIRGIIVTSKNEASLGLVPKNEKGEYDANKGLMVHLKGTSSVDPTQTIALVMVEQNEDGTFHFIDENGEKIENPSPENTIYQVFPATLDWSEQYKGQSMFRKGIDDNVKTALSTQFEAWRTKTLLSPSDTLHEIQASWGNPVYVTYKEINKEGKEVEQRDYRAKTSLEDAQLVSESEIPSADVQVVTKNDLFAKGNFSISKSLGRVILVLSNSIVKLNNRRLNKNQALTIYKVLKALSENVQKNKNLKDEKSQSMLNWLKSTIYWGSKGMSESASVSQLWFNRTEDGLYLFFGKSGKQFEFKSSSIEDNKLEIIGLLEEMYTNTNSTMLANSVAKTKIYKEIIDIDEDGNLVFREWENYKTYLISKRYQELKFNEVTKEERWVFTTDRNDIPLTTNMRPIKTDVEGDVNKQAVYFTVTDLQKDYTIPEKKAVITPIAPVTPQAAQPAPTAPSAPIVTPTPVVVVATQPIVSKENRLIVDGVTENTSPEGYIFTYNGATGGFKFNIDKTEDKIGIEGMKKLYAAMGTTVKELDELGDEEYFAKFNIYIFNKVLPLIEKEALLQQQEKEALAQEEKKKQEAEKAEQAPEAPAGSTDAKADIEAKKADAQTVKNRMQEIEKQPVSINITQDASGKMEQTSEEVISQIKSELDKIGLPYTDVVANDKGSTYFVITKDSQQHEILRLIKTGDALVKPMLTKGKWINHLIKTQPQDLYNFVDAELAALETSPIVKETAETLAARRLEELSNYYDTFGEEGDLLFQGIDTPSGIENTQEFKDAVKVIYDKYDKLLADLKETSPAEETEVTPISPSQQLTENEQQDISNELDNLDVSTDKREEARKKLKEELKRFEPENWEQLTKWLKKFFPNVPVYRVKNIITSIDGKEEVWGMFKDGAIYVYENAEIGTVYHEVFEAVWKMFSSPEEQKAIIDEFRQRKGTFIDRPTGETIKYSEATPQQIKEQLAEEFRDYILYKKIPAKPTYGKPFILKLFSDLVNFIKEFFTGNKAQINTANLFEKISTGHYNKPSLYTSALALANKGVIDIDSVFASNFSEFRLKGIRPNVVGDTLQQMTYSILYDFVQGNKSFFNISKLDKTVYEKIQKDVYNTFLVKLKTIREELKEQEKDKEKNKVKIDVLNNQFNELGSMYLKTKEQWDGMVEEHIEYLKPYNIEFEDEDKNEDKEGRGDYQDASTMDAFKKADGAIKLLLSTLVRGTLKDGKRETGESSIGGVTLLPLTEVFIKVKENVYTSRTPEEMIERIRKMALKDSNYRTLYKRLTKTEFITNTFNPQDLEKGHQLQLIQALWKVMKQQKPSVKNLYIFENGEIEVGDSNFSSQIREQRNEIEAVLQEKLRNSENQYYYYNEKSEYYVRKANYDSRNLGRTNEETLSNELNSFGISFTKEEILKIKENDSRKYNILKDAVEGLKTSISLAPELKAISSKYLDINKRLTQIAAVRVSLDNPEYSSTFFNVKGERVQTFIGENAMSSLFNTLSQIENLSELQGTNFEYLLTDAFSQNSRLLNEMFHPINNEDPNSGKKKVENYDDLLFTIGWQDGMINEQTGKNKQSSQLNYKERLIQELNLNLKGWFLNLVPGDASLEWMVFMGNFTSPESISKGDWTSVYSRFRSFLYSEIETSREDRSIVKLSKEQVEKGATQRDSKDLRFFKGILSESLHNELVNSTKSIAEIHFAYKDKIDEEVKKYIYDKAANEKATLTDYGIIGQRKEKDGKAGTYYANGLNFEDDQNVPIESIDSLILSNVINYTVANIDLHKLIYSDPYQYKDELKRTKLFNSPHQPLIGNSDGMNKAFSKFYNEGYEKGDVHWTEFESDILRSITYDDIRGVSDKGVWDEGDGGGKIIFKAYRQFRIRESNWSDDNELQYRYDVAWEKRYKNEQLPKEEQKPLSEKEQELLKNGNPGVADTYTATKPKMAGNKANGKSYNDVLLDKCALFPISFRVMMEINPTANALKLYNKMQREKIDYVIYKSGRKVGAEETNPVYTDKGDFDETPFKGVVNVPFSIISRQSETPSKESSKTKMGSQITKIGTTNFTEAGVPIDFADFNKSTKFSPERFLEWMNLTPEEKETRSPIHKELQNNKKLIDEMRNNNYKSLLKKFGIKEFGKKGEEKIYTIDDVKKTVKLLRKNLSSINNNMIDALEDFENGTTILEATNSYQQLRNVLFAIADKQVISPKITGAQLVQMSSDMLESVRAEKTTINGKTGYTSDVLKFYEDKDGQRVCEIMVRRWFDSDMSDKELMDYFNNNPEGQKQIAALAGIAYRIPTQNKNSIDVFRVAKFLPQEFRDVVIVPSELVHKVGSDFDIDKLFIYLKNIVTGRDGKPKLIEFLDDNNSTIEERYLNWIRSNANLDTRNYIKFLTKKSVQNLKSNFELVLSKIKADYKFIGKEEKEDLFQTSLETSKSNIEYEIFDQEAYLQELFDMGKKVFWRMSDETRGPFWEVRDFIRSRNIKGPDEIKRYLSLTIALLEDETTIEDDIIKLEGLEKIYSEELRVIGETNEIINRIKKEALDNFRKNKKVLSEALRVDRSAEFEESFDIYKNIKSQISLEAAEEIANIDGLYTFEDFKKLSKYEQNNIEALENAYISSLEVLTSHPLNYEKLTSPNSAKELQDLSIEIVNKLGLGAFDYTKTSNLLDRRFMSRIRHAFVTGKKAIGVAATTQTGHSLFQKAFIYLNELNIKNLDKEDQAFVGDGKLNFFKENGDPNFNTVKKDGQILTTLSMIKDQAGKFITDTIGMFIDGYVDIANGPWIMELGATPNVAPTFLFLVRAGVPIKTIAYFINQPIIRDYLKLMETEGFSWLFVDKLIEEIKSSEKYIVSKDANVTPISQIPSDTTLLETIGKKTLSAQEKTEQKYILDEFLKYAKMADQLFNVTQATNFDTATINDPILVFKKIEQVKKAQNSIISSVDDVLESSFLGNLLDTMKKLRDAFGEILISDKQGLMRNVTENILLPYIKMDDRDFTQLAQKLVSNLFDWAVQVGDEKLNSEINRILLSKKGTAYQMQEFANSVKANPLHPLHNNQVIELLLSNVADKDNKPNNLKIKVKDNKVYNQNQMIYSFAEIKEYLNSNAGRKGLPSYDDFVKLSVLQSGTLNSPISFTSLIPYDDFKKLYATTISKLPFSSDVNMFKNLDVFQRNNWNNSEIVPKKKAKWVFNESFQSFNYINDNLRYNDYYKDVANAIKNNIIPDVIALSTLTQDAHLDIVSYSWEKPLVDLLTEEELKANPDEFQRIALGRKKQKEMKRKADFSYLSKGLFKKVYLAPNEPYMLLDEKKGDKGNKFVYKMINAWGDSFRANEFYDVPRMSIIDNGFEKTREVSDADIISYFTGNVSTEDTMFDGLTDFSDERKQEILTNFGKKHNMTKEQSKYYINYALQIDTQKKINKLKECY